MGNGLRIRSPSPMFRDERVNLPEVTQGPLGRAGMRTLPTANPLLVSGSNVMLRPSGIEASSQSLNLAFFASSS